MRRIQFGPLSTAIVLAFALFLMAGRAAFGQSVAPVADPVVVVVNNDNDSNDNDSNDNDGGTRVVRQTVEVTRTVEVEVPIAAAPPPPAPLVIPAAPPPPADPIVEAVTPPPVIPAAPPPPIVLPQVAVPRTGDGSTLALSQASAAQPAAPRIYSVASSTSFSGYSSVTVEAVIPAGFPRTGGDSLEVSQH